MVLCPVCGDAIGAGVSCATCGQPRDRNRQQLDPEGLLDRVGDALAAQAGLAFERAAQHTERATRLWTDTQMLRRRLRRQRMLLAELRAERAELRACLDETARRVDEALSRRANGARFIPGVYAEVELPRDASCGAVARRVLENSVGEELDAQPLADALLVVSVLAANAFVHGGGAIALRAELHEGHLHLEVANDDHLDQVEVRAGHGLWLVHELSAAWGAATRPTRVWADVPLAPPASFSAPI